MFKQTILRSNREKTRNGISYRSLPVLYIHLLVLMGIVLFLVAQNRFTTNAYFYAMILVTGGTGLIGSHLLFHLVQQGQKVKASYRTQDTLRYVTRVFRYYTEDPKDLLDAITWVQADLTDIGALHVLFKGVDRVYHCAALISFDPNDYKALKKNNVEGTANIVNLCLEYGVNKLCYVSSIAAIGSGTSDGIVTETTDWHLRGASVYGITKYQAELEVWRSAQEGLPVVIVNPGVVIGPGFWKHGSGLLFSRAVQGKKYCPPGGTGFVSVNDVVRAMTTLMISDITQERFILVSENRLYCDVLQKMALSLGVSPPTQTAPLWVLEIGWRMDWLHHTFCRKKRRLTKRTVKGLYNTTTYESNKVKTAIDFKFEDLNTVIDFCSAVFHRSASITF